MFKRDGEGYFIGLLLVIAAIALIIYLLIYLAGIIIAIASGLGILYGGGTAIVNYFRSFKEHIIDSNRNPAVKSA
jgi:hypothetical protein